MNYDRIILELMDRVATLEEDVAKLKTEKAAIETITGQEAEYDIDIQTDEYTPSSGGRDTTKYIFEGKRYGKNRLVLAVVKKYVSNNKGIAASTLMARFDKSIQGSLGVIRTAIDAKNSYSDYARRFFFQPNEIIKTSTEDCVVCTQWGKFNIGNFVARAEQLGMHIQTIGGVANSAIGYGDKMNSAFATSQLIGQETFMELYGEELDNLHENDDFMEFISQLRQKLNGSEISNTKVANTEIMNAFFYANTNNAFSEVASIVEKVKQYGKQASAHISIYYAMYVLDFQ